MTVPPATDWRSPLFGFAAACLAFTVLCLASPIRDKYVLGGAAGGTALLAFVLGLLLKPPAVPAESPDTH